MKDVRNLYETMIQSTATAANGSTIPTTSVGSTPSYSSIPTNGGTPLISVNATPFMTPVDTSATSPFVTPIMIISPDMSRSISWTDVRTALDGEGVKNALNGNHNHDPEAL